MKRYFVIALQFFKNGLMSQLAYRFETITWSVMSILWIVLMMLSIEFVFGQVHTIAGWSRDQVLLLASVEALFVGVMWAFILPSLLNFADRVNRGTLDIYLSKPVPARFLISVNSFEIDNFLRVIVSLLLIFNFSIKMGVSFSWNLVFFLLMFLAGIIIFYNLFFIATTTLIWLITIFNLEDLFSNIMNVGRYPVYIFEKSVRVLFIYVLPVAFIATFPVQALFGKLDSWHFILAVILVIISSLFSQWFWNFALKHYSSASS